MWINRFLTIYKLTAIAKKKNFIIPRIKKIENILKKFLQLNLIKNIKCYNNFYKITHTQIWKNINISNFKIYFKKSHIKILSYKDLQILKKYKYSKFYLLSTNKGVLSINEAIKKKCGGILICKII
jgi:ribosomal protein S8